MTAATAATVTPDSFVWPPVASGGSVTAAPQGSATTWAFAYGAKMTARTGEPPAALLTLVTIAHLAECALWSGNGYSGVSAGTVAGAMGVSTSTASKYMRYWRERGALIDTGAGVHRLPEHVVSRDWARR